MFQVRLPQDTAGEVALRSIRLRVIFFCLHLKQCKSDDKSRNFDYNKNTFYHAK